MKKILIYLSVISVSLAILPIQAEAGSWHKKKDRFWARHHGYSAREQSPPQLRLLSREVYHPDKVLAQRRRLG
jgi:hypothetical protein